MSNGGISYEIKVTDVSIKICYNIENNRTDRYLNCDKK